MKIYYLLLLPVICFAQIVTQIDNQILHLKGTVGVTLTEGVVSAWADQSGLGNDFIQISGGFRPDYNESSYITFDGTDEFLDHVDDDDFTFGNGTSDTPFSVISRFNPTDSVRFTPIAKSNANPTSEWRLSVHVDGHIRFMLFDDNIGIYIGKTSTNVIRNGVWTTVAATYSGNGSLSGILLYVDGVLDATAADVTALEYAAMTNTIQPVTVALDRISTDTWSSGSISDILMTKDVLTPTEVMDITTYFATGVYPVDATTETPKRKFGNYSGWGGW